MDIRKFFDTVPWDLVLKAVAHHTDQRWMLLYVERWLKAPLQREDGTLVERDRGTPQGSAISPLLANMFMHYAFDAWMVREFPDVPFERYCDDIIVHARSERQAQHVRAAVAARLAECGLELNEQKTRIVYCKDDDRRGAYEHTSFDFLSYTFRPRLSKNRFGKHFLNFTPAVSNEAKTAMRREMRRWRLNLSLGQDPHGPGAHVQHRAPGLDQLLRALLQVHVVSGLPPPQRDPREVGDAEIQTVAPPQDQGAQVPR